MASQSGSRRDPDVLEFHAASDRRDYSLDLWLLDELPGRGAGLRVAAVAQAVIAEEGPILETRLAKIVARRFGLERVRQERIDQIIATVPRTQRRRSFAGTFVWPADVTPDSYTAWRATPHGVSRSVEEISPHEIANAMAWLAASAHGIHRDELIREAAQVFDVQRLTTPVRQRLDATLKWAIKNKRLADRDGLIVPGPIGHA